MYNAHYYYLEAVCYLEYSKTESFFNLLSLSLSLSLSPLVTLRIPLCLLLFAFVMS